MMLSIHGSREELKRGFMNLVGGWLTEGMKLTGMGYKVVGWQRDDKTHYGVLINSTEWWLNA